MIKSRIACVGALIALLTVGGCATAPPVIDETLQSRALAGDMSAQYEVGMQWDRAAYKGWGTEEYWQEAERWFQLAADQGEPRAQYKLANYLFNFEQDYRESFRLTKLSAEAGIAEAQYSLGMHYGQAWGTEQDLVLAYKWIALGNAGGIEGGSLADVDWLVWKGKMNTEQVAEGKKLVAEHTQVFGTSRPAIQ